MVWYGKMLTINQINR